MFLFEDQKALIKVTHGPYYIKTIVTLRKSFFKSTMHPSILSIFKLVCMFEPVIGA